MSNPVRRRSKRSATSDPSTRRKGFWILFGVLVAGTSTLLALSVGELSLRLRLQEEQASGAYFGLGAFQAHPDTGYVHRPGFRGRAFRAGAFDCPVAIDAPGLRQRDTEAQLGYPQRLLLLGDSFVFGLGVAEEQTFATALKVALNAEGVGVINGGQTGYGVAQAAAWGKRLLSEVEPEAVLLTVYVGNDFENDYYKDYKRVEIIHGRPLDRERVLPWAAVDYLRTHSYLWMRVAGKANRAAYRKRLEEWKRLVAAPLPERLTVMEPTLSALRSLLTSCAQHDAMLGVAILPTRRRPPEIKYLVPHLRNWLEGMGVVTLQLSPKTFKRKKDFLGPDDHWSASGHAKAMVPLHAFAQRLLSSRSPAGP